MFRTSSQADNQEYLTRQHAIYTDTEQRKFRRRKILQFHLQYQDCLKEVGSTILAMYMLRYVLYVVTNGNRIPPMVKYRSDNVYFHSLYLFVPTTECFITHAGNGQASVSY